MSRSAREPVFNVPGSVLLLLAALTGVHLVRLAVPEDLALRILTDLAFVPIRLTGLFAPETVSQQIARWAAQGGVDGRLAAIAVFFRSQGSWPAVPSLLTYALLHGGWAHLGLNGIWLLAFGTPVARRFGSSRFLVFMGVTAVAGALTHWALFPLGAEPLIGASAAVSGCMGAAMRFAFRTRAPIEAENGAAAPDESLRGALQDRRAVSFLLAWFATNTLFGLGATAFGLSDQPIAWQAHIGGLLVGLLLFPWFAPAHKGEP